MDGAILCKFLLRGVYTELFTGS